MQNKKAERLLKTEVMDDFHRQQDKYPYELMETVTGMHKTYINHS